MWHVHVDVRISPRPHGMRPTALRNAARTLHSLARTASRRARRADMNEHDNCRDCSRAFLDAVRTLSVVPS